MSGKAKVEVIPYAVASNFILRYEWLGNMGTSKYCFGLFIGEVLCAVACLGPPVAPSKYSQIAGMRKRGAVLQLCRGASSHMAPPWAGSFLISRSLRLLKRMTGVQLVVAYADPDAGEVGVVYQASNALYLGMTDPGGAKKYKILGRVYDPRKVHKKFGTRARGILERIDPDYQVFPITSKHRYVFVTASGTERDLLMSRIKPYIRPFPKRA